MEDILNIFLNNLKRFLHKFSMYINTGWRLQFCSVNYMNIVFRLCSFHKLCTILLKDENLLCNYM